MNYDVQEIIAQENINMYMAIPAGKYRAEMRAVLEAKNSDEMTSEVINKMEYEVDENGVARLENINIYPQDYFCPVNYISGEMSITQNTRSIHHYAATWLKKKSFFKNILQRFSWLKCRFFMSKFYYRDCMNLYVVKLVLILNGF